MMSLHSLNNFSMLQSSNIFSVPEQKTYNFTSCNNVILYNPLVTMHFPIYVHEDFIVPNNSIVSNDSSTEITLGELDKEESLNRKESSISQNIILTPNIKQPDNIWRPFTPEPEFPKLKTDKHSSANNFIAPFEQRNENVCLHKTFPKIIPSNIKLGSSESVFKLVKKKKYKCEYCDSSYSNHGQLTGHIRSHMGFKPFHCKYPHCNRSFARNEELTRHKRIHSGYKPYQCNICQKQFGRKDHLNKHCKTHLRTSEKKVYECQIPGCGHKYTRSDALTRHRVMAHPIATSIYN